MTIKLTRRKFLKISAILTTSLLMPPRAKKPVADGIPDLTKIRGSRIVISVCQYCGVGCGVLAYERDGKLVNLEGDPVNPINRGTLCPKGLFMYQVTTSPRRLTVPLYRSPGSKNWQEISWEEAIRGIASKIKETRDKYWDETRRSAAGLAVLGSALVTNEEVYLLTKLARVLGVTSYDHQCRMCHAPTMWGLQVSTGHGGMHNTFTDVVHSRCILILSNPAECHPIAMRHIVQAKEKGAKIIVVDPRFTRTAAMADRYVRLRSGTDITFIGGIINYLIRNNLYDRWYVEQFTNALFLVDQDYKFNEGIFSGYNKETGSYNMEKWKYQLDEKGQPKRASSLNHPWSVFSLLNSHFSRYTPDLVENITGVPREILMEVAETMARHKPGAVVFSVGSTQHTTGTQNTRSYAILQLLLGNVGKAGGGIVPYRGHSNIQGATDLGANYETLPGYPGQYPTEKEKDLETWTETYGKNAEKILVALLKAWFGNRADASNDWGYRFLPLRKSAVKESLVNIFKDFGNIRTLLCFGENPAVSNPDQHAVLRSLARLETLVVVDLFENETAAFWKAPGADPGNINTEVYLLPAAAGVEKEGSRTNSSRWIQWGDKAVNPPGEAQPDLWIIDALFNEVKGLYQGSSLAKDAPVLHCQWDYGIPPRAESVLKEISGYYAATGEPVKSREEANSRKTGEIAVGCWIYAGVFARENRAKARDNTNVGGVDIYPGWAYSYPDNIRVLGNRASCNENGQPLNQALTLIRWDGKKWTGPDIPDIFIGNAPPTTEPGKSAFMLNAENVARLCALSYRSPDRKKVSRMVEDGPFPEHYEPVESPVPNLLHPEVQTNPAVAPQEKGDPAQFPHILTTYRVTEHHTGGPLTRNLPWAAEMEPELFVELSPGMGKALGVTSADYLEVNTARGSIRGRALVSPRVQPLKVNGRLIEHIGVPYHWGFMGLVTGDSANILTIDALDPTAQMPQLKVCLCNVRKI
ncbi:MAG: formate dehydrogenase-N subunit alpha [Firmicutes bacterium HGW-Firmicutes-8]|nr:MAG: formate dehydrogenase-N subunit alpha [Firmicutes bacterium HGW-Firmicutes-8]